MDIEEQLRKLETRYRAASSAAGAAKAHYFALSAEPGVRPEAIALAKENWQRLENRKREISSRMGEVELL